MFINDELHFGIIHDLRGFQDYQVQERRANGMKLVKVLSLDNLIRNF